MTASSSIHRSRVPPNRLPFGFRSSGLTHFRVWKFIRKYLFFVGLVEPAFSSPFVPLDADTAGFIDVLHMYSAIVCRGKRGLTQRLRIRRVGVANPCDVFGRGPVFHGYGSFSNHVCGTGADHVYAQHLVGTSVCQYLYETIRIAAGLGTATGFEGKGACLVLMSLGFQLFFGFTYAGHFGPGVYDARNEVVIDMGFLACQPLGHIHAFIFGFVGEHGALYHVADGIYACYGGFEVLVHGYLFSALFQGDADVFQSEPFRIGGAAHRHDAVVALPFDGFAFCIFSIDRYLLPLGGGTGYFVAQVELHAERFLQHALQFLAQPAIHGGDNAFFIFDDRYLGAQSRIYGAQLQPDNPATDDDQVVGYLFQCQRFRGGDDSFFVDWHEGERGRL